MTFAESSQAVPASETIGVLQNRVSVRAYADRPVGDDLIDEVLKAAFRAPTSSNIQAYSVVIVRDQAVKDALAPITGNQQHVKKAPVFLAFCADITRLADAKRRHGIEVDTTNLESCLVASIDAALVGMSAYLAADSVGLKGVMIGAVRNDAVATAKVLNLPKGVYCVFGMCLGFPADAPEQKPRMDYGAMVHRDQYGNQPGVENSSAAIDLYNQSLADHYRGSGRETSDASWSDEIAKKFEPQPRANLRAQLKELGFDFE